MRSIVNLQRYAPWGFVSVRCRTRNGHHFGAASRLSPAGPQPGSVRQRTKREPDGLNYFDGRRETGSPRRETIARAHEASVARRRACPPGPPSESPARRPAGRRLHAPRTPPRARTADARRRPLRIRRPHAIRLFPDHSHRFPALRHGGRRIGRNRGRRQRGHARHFAVHGRRDHAQPRRRAKRGLRRPAEGQVAQGRVRALRPDDASVAALHPGADHPDGADGRVQSASFGRPAVVPVAVAEPGSPVVERARR